MRVEFRSSGGMLVGMEKRESVVPKDDGDNALSATGTRGIT